MPSAHRSLLPILVVTAAALAYVGFTSAALPEVVAVHFRADGSANGFMFRDGYRRFVLMFIIGLPLVFGLLPGLSTNRTDRDLRIPNAAYWLAPERRAEAIAFVREHLARLGALLVVFVCAVHWLVLRANAVVPPRLPVRWMLTALALLVLGVLWWARAFVGRFRRP